MGNVKLGVTLYSFTKEYCEGKILKRQSHAEKKNALNIENLSEASLKRIIQLG